MWDLLSAFVRSTARQTTSSPLVFPVVHLQVPLMVECCFKKFLSPPSPSLRVFGIIRETFAEVSVALNLKIKAVLS